LTIPRGITGATRLSFGFVLRPKHNAQALRYTGLLICAVLSITIAVAGVVSYFTPLRFVHLGASRADGETFISHRQDVFAAAGGIYFDFETVHSRKRSQPNALTDFGSGSSLVRSYPRMLRDPKDTGVHFQGGGFAFFSLHSGPAYIFLGGWLPSMEEMTAHPEKYGEQLWLSRHQIGAILPWWVMFLIGAVYPLVAAARSLRRRRRMRRIAANQCAACGYDLRASSGRCPECGEAVPT
jgi:hypothetical protein